MAYFYNPNGFGDQASIEEATTQLSSLCWQQYSKLCEEGFEQADALMLTSTLLKSIIIGNSKWDE